MSIDKKTKKEVTRIYVYFMTICLCSFAFLVITALFVYGSANMQTKRALNNFSHLIESKNLDDLHLTIYYISPLILTPHPLSADNLISRSNVNKTVVHGDSLETYRDLLKQLNADAFAPVNEKSYIDARLCYVFENSDGKLLTVAFGGVNDSIFVNGVEVKNNKIFTDVIRPFLTEDSIRVLAVYFR
jgi:hypothetical protein